MTRDTKRDRVWDAALRLALDSDTTRFTTEDVLDAADLDTSTKRTANDVLRTMWAYGWLTGSKLTRAGPSWKRAWRAGPELP